jgi:DegV family protein with EDD domain
MDYKIVMDSAGDMLEFPGAQYACVPLKILAGDREFVDDATTDVVEMVDYLGTYVGKSSTACPSAGEYLEAFEDAEDVYCVTITSGLSGSYNAATVASQTYLEMHPDKKVHVFDSLSAGPEMTLMTEKIRELVEQKLPFEKIVETVEAYKDKVRLVFSLESLHNLAQNGRVPVAVAKLAGLIGLRLIGKASDVGTLQPTGKARGEKKVVPELLKQLLSMGYQGGRVRIHHCCNLLAAENLKQALLEKFPAATVIVEQAGALCSFYAERGGLLVGFET